MSIKSPKTKRSFTLGFSLVETIAVVAVASILSGISLASYQRNWQQERLKAATRQITSWIEDVRMKALQESQTCAIEIVDSSATLQPTADTNYCSQISALKVRGSVDNGKQIQICSQESLDSSSFSCTPSSSNSTPTEITFTPRGTVSQGGLILLHLSSHISNRCIAITQPLGMIRQGIDRQGICNYNSAY